MKRITHRYQLLKAIIIRRCRMLPVILVLAMLFAPGSSGRAQTPPDIIVFQRAEANYLRWKGLRSVETEGFHLYRRADGSGPWELLTATPLQRLRRLDEIRSLLQLRSELLLTLYGAVNPLRDIDDSVWRTLFSNSDAVSFLQVVSLINWDFGFVHAEIYIDSALAAGSRWQYRVTALEEGGEVEVGTSDILISGTVQEIPPVDVVEVFGGNESVRLRWERHLEAMKRGDVVTYNVYRSASADGPFERVNTSGILPVNVSSGDRTTDAARQEFQDKFLTNGSPYFYLLRSVNAFGFESAPSPLMEVTPRDDRAVLPPRNIRVERFGVGAILRWEPRLRSQPKGYEIYKSQARDSVFERVFPLSDVLLAPQNEWIDIDIAEGREYFYFLRTVGEADQRSNPSDTISFFVPDMTPPARPRGVRAVADTGTIRIMWQPAPEPDLLGYMVERASDDDFFTRFLLTSRPITDTLYIDSLPPQSQTTYGYVVCAIDRSYNRSEQSEMVKARMPDIVAPQAPFVVGLEAQGPRVRLSWTAVPADDLAQYRVFRSRGDTSNFVAAGGTPDTSFGETAPDSGFFYYAVQARDRSGNASPRSRPYSISVSLDDIPAPPAGGGVERGEGGLRITWEASPSANTAGYVLARRSVADGKLVTVAQPEAGQREFTDRQAQANEEYVYIIKARDKRWRQSDALEIPYKPE